MFNQEFNAKRERASMEVHRLRDLLDGAEAGSNRQKVLTRALKKAERVEAQLTDRAEQVREVVGNYLDSRNVAR